MSNATILIVDDDARARQLTGPDFPLIGVGGIGTHLVQQLALLGVGRLHLVDGEEVEETNRRRLVRLRLGGGAVLRHSSWMQEIRSRHRVGDAGRRSKDANSDCCDEA